MVADLYIYYMRNKNTKEINTINKTITKDFFSLFTEDSDLKKYKCERCEKTFSGKRNSKYCIDCKIPHKPEVFCVICEQEVQLDEDQCCKPCRTRLQILKRIVYYRVRLQFLDAKILRLNARLVILKDPAFVWHHKHNQKMEIRSKRKWLMKRIKQKQLIEFKIESAMQSL